MMILKLSKKYINIRMGIYIQENIRMKRKKEKEYTTLKMGINIQENLNDKFEEKGNYIIMMERNIMKNGKMIKQKE